MGNDQSTVIEEERRMLESLYQISEGRLDTPDVEHVDSRVNSGTSAPNCQPSHTIREIEEERDRLRRMEEEEIRANEVREAERLAELLDIDDTRHREYVSSQLRDNQSSNDTTTTGRGNGGGGIERTDSLASNGSTRSQSSQPEKGSIGSFVQMAKTGYQELVNAIIR
jgi:hypothetical protein